MLQASYFPYRLLFRQPAGTSRGVLTEKPSWFLLIRDTDSPQAIGIGECSIIPGLSMDPPNQLEQEIIYLCQNITEHKKWSEERGTQFPALTFALETALADLNTGGQRKLFDNEFTAGKSGIPINGLIWMGEKTFMKEQIKKKIESGFTVIKLKVGAIQFDEELELLRWMRTEFSSEQIMIRLDANGAFTAEAALDALNKLSDFDIHSIEQPIQPGQWEAMSSLCEKSPIPIALDEELIGVNHPDKQQELLRAINPAYIILKPSLVGGLAQTEQWIQFATSQQIGWWATSALESNIGLNCIAQWVASQKTILPQGLGTGQLYRNNFDSPLVIRDDKLWSDPDMLWNLSYFDL